MPFPGKEENVMTYEQIWDIVVKVFNEQTQPIDGWTEEIAQTLYDNQDFDYTEDEAVELTLQYLDCDYE